MAGVLKIRKLDGSYQPVEGYSGFVRPPGSFDVANELGDNINLNSITQPGLYVQTQSTEASTGNNYPVAIGGLLEVFTSPAAGIIWQRYTVYAGHVTYGLATFIRGRTDNTWSTWEQRGGKPIWTNVTLLNGWQTYFTPLRWTVINGMVTVQAMVRNGTVTAGTVIGVLPSSVWPSTSLLLPAITSPSTSCRIDIDASGNVLTGAGVTTAWVAFNVTYPKE